MKYAIMVFLLSFSAFATSNHVCTYKLREQITLRVFNGQLLSVQSNRLSQAAVFPILDQDETDQMYMYAGDLGSPWTPGTSFVLKISKNSPFSLYQVIAPNGRTQSNIRTTCVTL